MTMEIVSETDFGRPQNPFVPNFYRCIGSYETENRGSEKYMIQN